MTVRIRIPQFLFRASSQGPVALAAGPAHSTFHAALTDSAEDWVIRGTPLATFTPRPAASPVQQLGPGMLTRAWTWLRAKYTQTATKRLRVAETVSLGEKRFVSIVRVEGREFLIGGGASGVSLLAQLGPAPESAEAARPNSVQSIQRERA
jgi:hypothetical protein